MNSAGAASILIAVLCASQVWAQAPSLTADQAASGTKLVDRNGLPNLGDGSDMTLGAERRLGDRIARSLYRDLDYVDDPVISDYLQGIWQPLLAFLCFDGIEYVRKFRFLFWAVKNC